MGGQVESAPDIVWLTLRVAALFVAVAAPACFLALWFAL
jgi:hypothetical protein